MKKYNKPQIDICHITAAESMLDLSIHNEEGSGIQRAKQFIRFDELMEDETDEEE